MAQFRILRWIVAAVLLGAAAWITTVELIEAYGSGPPFYGRTTNMDKWSSPWPLIMIVDATALLLAFLLAPRRR